MFNEGISITGGVAAGGGGGGEGWGGSESSGGEGGVGGMAARLALATGRKTGGASFDLRSSFMGG